MTYRITNYDILPPARELAQAAARGAENLIKSHLRSRDSSRPTPGNGMPRSGYWADAADSTHTVGNVVEIDKEGVALHYFGGTVRPTGGKKALAVPIDPRVAGIWPSESGQELDVVWSKKNHTGFLKDPDTSDFLWLLIPKATIKADRTVLPEDGAIIDAAADSIMDYLEAMS